MDKKEYHAPEIETVIFDREDIIRTSGGTHETRLPFITGSSGLSSFY